MPASSSSTSCPPRPPLLRLFHFHFRLAPPPLPPCQPCQLVAKLFANCPAQCALLDVNLRAAQLSVHRWTSTCELPSSVCTAGPQPGTYPAQHRWTSTCELPSSVCTAGPQRTDRMPEDMPDGMSDRMPEDMPDKMP